MTVNTVTVNGVTYTDDGNATTGLASGGHRERFIPCLSNALIDFAAKQVAAASANGVLAITYAFDTTTTDADPTAGKLRLGSATQNAATVIRADLLDSLGVDWTTVLDTFDVSTNTVKGQVRLSKVADGSKWLTFNLTARAAPSGYRNFTVTNTGSSAASPFVNGDSILLSFTRAGDLGATGATGAAGTNGTNGIFSAMGAAGGTVDAITANFTPDITLADQTLCAIVCAGANTITAPTFTPDGLPTRTIKARGGAALKIGDIAGAGFVALIEYNLAGTYWELLNPSEDKGIGVHEIVMTSSNGAGSTNTKFGRFTTTESSAGTSITYADSATLGGSWTINDTGKYAVHLEDAPGLGAYFGISKNSAQGTTNIQNITATDRLMQSQSKHATYWDAVSGVFQLTAGDVLRNHIDVSASSGVGKLRILRLS